MLTNFLKVIFITPLFFLVFCYKDANGQYYAQYNDAYKAVTDRINALRQVIAQGQEPAKLALATQQANLDRNAEIAKMESANARKQADVYMQELAKAQSDYANQEATKRAWIESEEESRNRIGRINNYRKQKCRYENICGFKNKCKDEYVCGYKYECGYDDGNGNECGYVYECENKYKCDDYNYDCDYKYECEYKYKCEYNCDYKYRCGYENKCNDEWNCDLEWICK